MALISLEGESTLGDVDPKAQDYLVKAMSYLMGSGSAKKILETLEGCGTDFYVFTAVGTYPMFCHAEVAMKHGYKGGVVAWDPKATITALNGKMATLQSPAIGLIHEMGHALQWQSKHGWFMSYVGKAMSGDNKSKLIIENANINDHETPVAKELGEGTRKDYESASNFKEAEKNYKCPYQLLPLGHAPKKL